ncbi:MAG TPA: FAD/NAD(P)-binding oxidoreductase [Woeseiaceae bacterium]
MNKSPDVGCVIVGAGHAGTQVATRLRRLGWKKPVTLVGEENTLPYHRPPLSKDYLKGVRGLDSILLAAAASYEKADIELCLNRRATRIDRQRKRVEFDTAPPLAYEKLVLTTGARPKNLPLPGALLDGVHYLRSAGDVDRIRAAARAGRRAIIIGGGYIGLEVAESLCQLNVEVTVLEALDRVLKRVTCETMSHFFARIHREEKVRVETDAAVRAITGDGGVRGVQLSQAEFLDADMVVIGIGVTPNVELAEEAGLAIDNGIAVDAFGRTSDPHILAAGDCTSFVHPRYERRIRLESVQNANDQGAVAARTICGELAAYDAVPWFWSDQFDVKLQIAGLAECADDVVIRGDPDRGRELSIVYLEQNRLLAIDAANRPRDFVQGRKLLTESALLDPARVADPAIPLTDAIIGWDARNR